MYEETQQTAAMTGGGETTPAVAGIDAEFEELIQGRCKQAFQARVQTILEKRLRTLRQENETLRRQCEEQRRYEQDCVERLAQEAEDIRRLYDDFDWQEEMRIPVFGRLIAAGVDGRTAYEVTHGRELLAQAMRYAAQRDREQLSRTVASSARRIPENGGGSTAVTRTDPRALTSSELSDIRRRVQRGEKIRF